MSEVTNKALVAVPGVTPNPTEYARAREVRARAAFTRPNDPEDLTRAMNRLQDLLGSGQPPRSDVPRGFYFNARI
ncbi:MAG: hypothetical protein QGG17_04770 [Rhodospirillales bacterium]|jgi:hypothetical protein|nr:hypothetical protein [Rhodospirillales bacterium]MDP6804239.1 hypothetical protein [Rhodospirillales bacterium]